jgi:hypothetical protein
MSGWAALYVGAAPAPTDGALGASVLLSVVAHGLSSGPLAQRYARRHEAAAEPEPGQEQHGTGELPVRGLAAKRTRP